ncbi:hypothetical protein [Streptomyces sp. NPDC046859]|uniref:hypothetical protein n=1 Tax=Streptomyces sp. NPDC046859 TaxID=3155734 RepID=UPI0033FF7978
MDQLTYPRTAAVIAARARMALAAYRAVPGQEATHRLAACLQDMWHYGYFALHNDDTPTSPWTETRRQLFDALQLLKPAAAEPAHAARAAAQAIHRFEQATGVTPGTQPEPLHTRSEAERAAHAAFERLRLHIKLDHDHDRQFVTEAFLACLDNPDSPYPYKGHDSDGEGDDGDKQPELSPEETGERENSLRYWLGPRTDTLPDNS